MVPKYLIQQCFLHTDFVFTPTIDDLPFLFLIHVLLERWFMYLSVFIVHSLRWHIKTVKVQGWIWIKFTRVSRPVTALEIYAHHNKIYFAPHTYIRACISVFAVAHKFFTCFSDAYATRKCNRTYVREKYVSFLVVWELMAPAKSRAGIFV